MRIKARGVVVAVLILIRLGLYFAQYQSARWEINEEKALILEILQEKKGDYGGKILEARICSVTDGKRVLTSKLKDLRVTIYTKEESTSYFGKYFYTDSLIAPIDRATNPGERDSFYYAMSKRIIGVIKDPILLSLNPPNSVFDQWRISIRCFFRNQRERLEQRILQVFHPLSAGFVRALLLGEKSGLAEETEENFRNSGVSHIVAVSGLHMGMLALLVQGIGKGLFLKPRQRFYLMFVVLIYYNFLLGLVMSAIRATIMVLLLQWSVSNELPYDKGRAMFSSFYLSLLFVPESLVSAGFLLSYFAVIGIFYIYPTLAPKKTVQLPSQKEPFIVLKRLSNYILFQSSILMATWPILGLFFGKLTLMAYVANLLVVPLIAYMYIGSVVVLFVSLANMTLAGFMGASVEVLTRYLIEVTERLAQLGWGDVYLGKYSFLAMSTYYLFLYLALIYLTMKKGQWQRIWRLVK